MTRTVVDPVDCRRREPTTADRPAAVDDDRYRDQMDSPDPSVAPAVDPHRRRARLVGPAWGPLVIAAFIGLVIATNVATAVWARWIDTNPAGLLALSSRNRYLALTLAAGVPTWAYLVIASVRIAIAFIVCHLIGRAYRTQALNWFTRYLGLTPASLDAFQRLYERAKWVVIPFFVGSNIVGVLSGIQRTSAGKVALLLGVGIAARLMLFWWLARVFEAPLVDFLEFVQRYQWWVVGISVALMVAVNARNLRSGARR